jgi:hypothetical protein
MILRQRGRALDSNADGLRLITTETDFPEADFWTTSKCAIKCRTRSAVTQADAAIATSLHR